MATVKAIKYGMKGDDVSKLQAALKNAGYNIDVDGSFGPQTLAAVKQYQKANGLTIDGMVGPQTQARLFGGDTGGGMPPSKPNISDQDYTDIPSSIPTIPPQNTTSVPGAQPMSPQFGGPSAPDSPDTTSTQPIINVSASSSAGTLEKNTGSGSATPTNTEIKYPDNFSYGDFSYEDYKSSGAVDKATANPFSYGDFSYGDYKSSGAVDKATANPFSYDDFSYGNYQESETVTQAKTALDELLSAQPGAYQSRWQSQLDDIIGRILNRQPFSYDFSEDALYKQYAEQYMRRGKLAMQDTMGQAAAMTGGYGSSYASTAGNQAYQEYLSQLNEVIPELYGMALDRYQMEGQDMYNQYGLLSAQDQQEYGRYRDSYNQWLAERDYATGRYDRERDSDYSKYVDERNFAYNDYSEDRNLAYNEYLNAIENAKWKETDEYNKYLNDRNFEYGKYAEDRDLAYNEYLNAIENAKWKETDEYNKYLNDRNFAYNDYSEDRNLAYNEYLNAIENAKWKETDEYNKYLNDRNFEYGKYAEDRNLAYKEHLNAIEKATGAQKIALDSVYTAIENGVMPSDKDIAASGLDPHYVQELYNSYEDKETEAAAEKTKAEAMDKINMYLAAGMEIPKQLQKQAGLTDDDVAAIVAASTKSTSGSTTSKPMSPDDLEKWSDAVLDAETEEDAMRYLTELEKINSELADYLYEKWRREHGGNYIDTTVTNTTVNNNNPNLTGGGGGKIMVRY